MFDQCLSFRQYINHIYLHLEVTIKVFPKPLAKSITSLKIDIKVQSCYSLLFWKEMNILGNIFLLTWNVFLIPVYWIDFPGNSFAKVLWFCVIISEMCKIDVYVWFEIIHRNILEIYILRY